MKTKIAYQLVIVFFLFIATCRVVAAPITTSQNIKIDQFGYRINDQKIAIISNPQVGYNATAPFIPGNTYEVRDWMTNAVVYSATITPWNGGITHAQSGDKVWWFDFSSVTMPGSYYVFDPTNNVGSYRFEINDCVYNEALKRSVRTFYYQRCGSAKQYPFVDTGYVVGVCHKGVQQDVDCRLYNDSSIATSKDLSGGWHDAGDHNKYVNYSGPALSDMLLAYEEKPTLWTDNYNIPESGNGVPDLLDEVKVELDWLLKMQNANGSILSVVGTLGSGAAVDGAPTNDNLRRRYGPATTCATHTGAGVFALASIQFRSIGNTAYANTLKNAAINAWNWATTFPADTFHNAGIMASSDQQLAPYDRMARKVVAAIYLFAATGDSTTYRTYVDANYTQMNLTKSGGFAFTFGEFEQDALLYYTKLPHATASVTNSIIAAYGVVSSDPNQLNAYLNKTDAYRAYLADADYVWGSNIWKSEQANMFLTMNRYGFDAPNATNYTNAASGFVHYMHGVNPNSKTYLSNMGKFGAENSVSSIYHGWFCDGSPLWDEVGISTYGPAPGFVTGGANPTYAVDACCLSTCASNTNCLTANLIPPLNQPIQKSYKDFNTSSPANSWTVTEPSISNNAAYIRMLSKFCSGSCALTSIPSQEVYLSSLIQALYPQPTEKKVTIKFFNHENALIHYVLLDINGKELINSKQTVSANSLLDVDLSFVSAGVYFLKITASDKTEIKKIIKE